MYLASSYAESIAFYEGGATEKIECDRRMNEVPSPVRGPSTGVSAQGSTARNKRTGVNDSLQ